MWEANNTINAQLNISQSDGTHFSQKLNIFIRHDHIYNPNFITPE